MAGSKLGAFWAAKSANIAGRCLVVSVTSATTSSVTGRVLSNRRLSKFSIDHAISLILKAPTIRPDPFKVWKPLRISVNGVKSCASCCQIGKKSSKSATTSSTSSIKISRISSSTSKLSGLSSLRTFNKAALSFLSLWFVLSVKSMSSLATVIGAISPLSS